MRFAMAFGGSLLFSGAILAQQPVPPPKLDPAVFDSYLGSYELPSGRTLVIARTERRLYAYEPGSERVRGLDRVDDATWVAGPTLLVFTPESYRLTFLKNQKGAVTGVRYAVRGARPMLAKKARIYREESVAFRNGDVTLSGTLLVPASNGPHPAIVLAHGSGAQDRNGYLGNIRFMADHLARHGIAVLTYDKRGSGRSTGEWATASFEDLAGDLVAGIRMLRTRRDIVATQVGAGGSSQAGWVAAKAVTQLPDIAFVMITSAGGSGYTVEEQNLYNTEVEMRAAHISEERISLALALQRQFFGVLRRGERADASQYDAAVRTARGDTLLRDWLFPLSSEVDWHSRNAWYTALEVSFDPLPAWRAYKGPVLGVFGELDAQTPVAGVVPRFTDALMSRKGADFTVTVFPNASHLLLEATRASDDELATLQRVVPGFFDFVSDWLRGRLQRQKAVPRVAGAQSTILVETLPRTDSLPRRSPFAMAPPDMKAAGRLVGCYSLTLGQWSNPRAQGDSVPVPSRLDLLSDRHTRIYIGFGLVARTPGFSAQREAYPPAWSPIGDDSLQVRAWADGRSSIMLFLRRQPDKELRGTLRYFTDERMVDSTGRWLWESYPAATVSLRPAQC